MALPYLLLGIRMNQDNDENRQSAIECHTEWLARCFVLAFGAYFISFTWL